MAHWIAGLLLSRVQVDTEGCKLTYEGLINTNFTVKVEEYEYVSTSGDGQARPAWFGLLLGAFT